MDNEIGEKIKCILNDYGDAVFLNAPRINALLLDVAPGLTRERIQIRNFIETGGWSELKNAGGERGITAQ
ncbi:MAG: hypothetical protein FWE82_07395 [Defluviitaleaceae bacterium]|nr:hypothetical protein [Defluviitaleaceae bacterium]